MKLHLVKILKIIYVIICFTFILENCVLATSAFDVKGQFNGTTTANISGATNSAQNILFNVLDVVRYVGLAIAVVMLMFVAVKFMTAAPAERANIKQYSINYVIGAAILFGASGILTVVKSLADTAFSDT